MKVDGWWVTVGVVSVVGVALLVFNGNSTGGLADDEPAARSVSPDRSRWCEQLSGTPKERFDACIAALAPPTLSKAALKEVQEIADAGKMLVLGDQLPGVKGEQVEIAGQAAIAEALLATDEAALAKLLRDGSFRGVIVHRDLTVALDRDAMVASRLANHDFLEWFQLRYVTPEILAYTVRGNPARITDATGEALLSGLRARLEGRTPARQTWAPDAVRLMASIRLQGQTLALRHSTVAKPKNGVPVLEAALDELADKLQRRWDREVEPMGFGPLQDRLDEARIEVHVVLERARVEPRSRFAIFDLWEIGIDGAMLTQGEGKDQKFGYMPGSEAVAHGFKSPDQFLQHASKEGGWRDRRPWEKAGDVDLDIIRGDHFMEKRAGGGEVARMMRGMPTVSMDEMTDETIRDMLVDGGEWWLRNQHEDGSFVYKYWPEQNRYSDDYNEVRHILSTRDLADTWRYRQDPRYLQGAREAMDWLLEYEVEDTDDKHATLPHPPAGTTLFRYPHANTRTKVANQKLGTVAVALLGWVEWAKATGSKEEDARIRKMANFVLAMQDENGKFEAYYVPRGHSYFGSKNDIVPGEAALALGEVAEYFGEKEWIKDFPKFLDWYEPWFRERAVKKNPYGRWPHHTYDNLTRLDLVQFGPWSVMASKQYYALTGDERAAKFGLEVADWMIDNYQWSEARSPWPDYVGGYYKLPEELPAMQSFCYSEGTAAAYTIAAKFSPEHKEKYDRATLETIKFLAVMQYDDVDSYFAARPEQIHGGIKYALNENKVRTDYVGHGLSTLSQYLDARAADPAVDFQLKPIVVTEPGPPRPIGRAALPKVTSDVDDEADDPESGD